MTAEEQRKASMGFREWTAHYEKEQIADREKINGIADIVGQMAGQVSKLTAHVESLIDNQKGVFQRINRPVQWGGLVSAASFVAILLGLVVLPMKEQIFELKESVQEEVQRNLKLHMMFVEQQQELAVKTAVDTTRNQTDIKWLMNMEVRLNDRLHQRAFITANMKNDK